jgi:hypothetical protein
MGRRRRPPRHRRGRARRGVAAGLAVLREQLFVARWRQMAPSVRDYLRAAAHVEDPTSGTIVSSEVARRLGLATSALSTRRAELIDKHQVLRPVGRDLMKFTQPGFGAWVRALATHPTRDELASTATPDDPARLIAERWQRPGTDGPPIELGPT